MPKLRRELVTDRLQWSRRVSLTTRILALNIIALALLAGSLFYLDSYRRQLLAERFALAATEARITADALAVANRAERRRLLVRIARELDLRLQVYDARDQLVADSADLGVAPFALIDPASEPWYQHAARGLDRGMDFVLGAPPIPDYAPAQQAKIAPPWPEVTEAFSAQAPVIRQRRAPDRTPVITAAVLIEGRHQVLLATRNAVDITQNIRDARQTLAIIVGVALLISVQLSLFLARTIVKPLRMLVRAAIRVRRGRDREVVVPRLPERGDEIGLLARAISDMTAVLRHRIDAVESFAADVAHEIKNPLASLRSALETLDKVGDPALRRELAAIAAHDVRRIDRLVTEIADASRIDAELSRTAFEPVDLAGLIGALISARGQSGVDGERTIAFHAAPGGYIVAGDAPRLERVIENLLDNAVSFSPPQGVISVMLERDEGWLVATVSDEGRGIPAKAREEIFARFHSLRPADEDFGGHSGLGLAIARTIIEAHDGSLTARDRSDGQPGACLEIVLPPWEEP